jgi:hypothetical protein
MVCVTYAASPAPAFAADLAAPAPTPAPPAAPKDWQFELTLDGWAPSLASNVGVLNFPTASANVGFFTLLDHLQGLFPGSFVAYNNNFILGADVFWYRLGASAAFGPGVFGGVNASETLNETFATAYGGVRLPIASPNLSVYGIIGARYFNLNASLTLNAPVVGFSRSVSQGKDWVDEIVGLTARYRIDDKWFLKFEADGGGYSGSGTWQVFPAVGYNWNPSITTSLGFRALYAYEQTPARIGNGSFRFQETMYGPELDVSYNF